MTFFSSVRQWFIRFFLRLAFTAKSAVFARRIVLLLQFFLPFDKQWALSDTHGTWVAEDIAKAKKEAIEDCVATSDVILFWIPGGGFRFDLRWLYMATFKTWIRALEADKGLKCTIFLPNYRYAPEHPFPAAVDDIVAAYKWLTETMQVPPQKILLGADGAGAAIALDAMFLKGIQFPGCIFVSPYTGLEAGGESWRTNGPDDYLSAAAIDRMEESYIPAEGDQPFRFLPERVDLAPFLPRRMLIMVGGDEVLLDEAGYLASRARNGGVQVTLVQSPEQTHLALLLGTRIVQKHDIWQYALDRFVEFVAYPKKS